MERSSGYLQLHTVNRFGSVLLLSTQSKHCLYCFVAFIFSLIIFRAYFPTLKPQVLSQTDRVLLKKAG